jgi:hypothetical protein
MRAATRGDPGVGSIQGGRVSRTSFLSRRPVARTVRAVVVLALVAGGGLLAAPPASAATDCAPFGSITVGRYWLNNNLWGQNSGSGTQCITSSSSSGTQIGWSTNWSWTGQSNSVKSYDSSVLGWHWGVKVPNTGLPTQLSANRNVNTSWQYAVTQNGANTLNVSYDLWLHTISNPTFANNPTDEVMVWTFRAGGAGPVGTRQATVSIGGTNWDLYRGNIGWNVFSFVRTTNTTSVSLNLRDFLNNLVSRGWMANSKFLTSVEAGTEVFIGSGRLDTSRYSTTIG